MLSIVFIFTAFILAACGETEKIRVRSGDEFQISVPVIINPEYEWRCSYYDGEYIEFLGEGYEAPSKQFPRIMSTSTKVFNFRALNKGTTEIVLTEYELSRGEIAGELQSNRYILEIV